ncbi:unnamed protein product, partial [Didymodactylos carnosus]
MASPSIPGNMLVSALIKGLLPLYHQQLYGKLSIITPPALFLSILQGIEQEMQWLSSQNQQQSTNINYPSEDQYIQPSVNAIRQRHHCTTVTQQNVNLKPPVYFQNNNNQQPRLDSTLLMNPRSDDQQGRPWNRNSQQYYSVQRYQRQKKRRSEDGMISEYQNPSPKSSLSIIKVNVNGRWVKALVDTGSSTTIIGENLLRKLHHKKIQNRYKIKSYRTANNSELVTNGNVELKVKRNNLRTTIMADISTTICTDLILGTDWCS